MVFKTFDNDIDKTSAKIGVLGKSFYDFIEITKKRNSNITTLINEKKILKKDAKAQVGSLWNNLFSSKSQMTDVDATIPVLENDAAKAELIELKRKQKEINKKKGSWDDYQEQYKGKEYLLDYAKKNDVLKASVDDVKKANQDARNAAIAHNAALQNQSLSAKAGQLALQGLAAAGNMLLMWGISKAIEGIVYLSEKEERAAENAVSMSASLKNFSSSFGEGSQKVGELSKRYEELSQGVSTMGENISLTDDQYAEYKSTISELSDLMPNLNTLFNEQGEKIGFVGGKLKDTAQEYEKYMKTQAQDYLRNGNEDGKTVQDILDDFDYSNASETYGWNNFWRDTVDSLIKSLYFGNLFDWKGKIDYGSEILGAEAEYSENEQLGILQNLVNTKKENWSDILKDSRHGDSKEANLVEDLLGIDVDKVADMTAEEYAQLQKALEQKINGLQQTLEGKAYNISSSMQTMLFGDDDYWDIKDDTVRNALSSIISGLNYDALTGLDIDLSDQLSVETWVAGMVDTIKNNENVADAFRSLFSLDLDALNPQEAKEAVNKYIKTIANAMYGGKATDEQMEALKKSYGFEIDTGLIDSVEEKLQKEYKNKAGQLTLGELKIASEIAVPKGVRLSWEELLTKIREKQGENVLSFEDAFNSSDFSDSKEKLLSLAKAGEITPDVLESTKEYNSLLKQTGLSADEAKSRILDTLTPMEKLAAAEHGLDGIAKAFGEFQEQGFVTASTLESLPDVFKHLKGYGFSLFENIVSNSSSTKEEIQEAFNQLISCYLTGQETLKGITDENKQIYISQLKAMGLSNAEETVNEYLENLSTVRSALDSYEKYLIQNKGKADEEYLKGLLGNNESLITALTSAYAADYNKWVELLAQKAQAYNKFVNAIAKSQDPTLSSDSLTAEEKAKAVVDNYEKHGAKSGSFSRLPSKLASSNALYLGKQIGDFAASPASYTESEYNYAKEYLTSLEEANSYADILKEALANNLNTIDITFDSYSGTPSSNATATATAAAEETAETFNWLETTLSRVQRTIQTLSKAVSATWQSWTKRNTALSSQLSETRREIALQQAAYEQYMAKAESIGLSESYKALVQNGSLSIEDITDETLKEQIHDYQDWYEKALSCRDAIDDLADSISSLYKTDFDNTASQFDSFLSVIEHRRSMLDAAISQTEEKGLLVSAEYYKALIRTEEENLAQLAQKKNALLLSLNNAVANGAIEEYSQDWYDMCGQIDGVTQAIEEANTAMIQYGNSIREIKWEVFDLLQERISDITSESDFLLDLFENDALYDKDSGKLTDEGQAAMGNMNQNLQGMTGQFDTLAETKIQSIAASSPAAKLAAYVIYFLIQTKIIKSCIDITSSSNTYRILYVFLYNKK